MIDKALILLYHEHKEALLNQIKLGYGYVERGNCNVGIINLGATCHLNSLLQTLYHINEFRQLIYDGYNDKPDSVILKELTLLFSLLDKGISSSISAKELTTAFGWTRSTIGSQQCSFELLNILIQALQETSTLLDVGIQKLFKGTLAQILLCPQCNYSSSKLEDFYYLSLDPPKSNNNNRTMNDIILDSFQKEFVDWKCSSCNNNVQASKYSEIKSLPRTLFIHLNRLNFDYTTMRRHKLTHSLRIPYELNSNLFYNNNDDNDDNNKQKDTYEFNSCIIHSGSANGGHYKCLARSNNNKYFDCNDGNVTELTDEEVQLLFNTSDDIISQKHSLIHENGYIFSYSIKNDNEVHDSIPIDVKIKVDEFNNNLTILQKLYAIHQGMLTIQIVIDGFKNCPNIQSLSTITLEVHNEFTLDELLEQVLLVINSKNLDDTEKQLITTLLEERCERIRLCKIGYNTRIIESFGGKESLFLKDLGIVTNSQLMLHHRYSHDDPFQEICPGDMTLRLLLWSMEKYQSQSLDKLYHQTIVLKAEKDPSLLQLKNEIIKVLKLHEGQDKFDIIYHTDRDTLLLNDDSKCLRRDFKICLFDDIIIDVINDNVPVDSSALQVLCKERNNIKLLFKNPCTDSETNYSVSIALNSPLLLLKTEIAQMLNIKPTDFYICRNSAGTLSLKDDTKTVQEYGLLDQSFIFIKIGAGCAKGEIMLIFDYIDEAQDEVTLFCDTTNINESVSEAKSPTKKISLGEFPISEKIKVLDLKKFILTVITSSKTVRNIPESYNHIRVRDSRKISEFLRNDRILNRAMLGLADGRKIVIEYLKEAEIIGATDIIINIRLLSCQRDRLSRAVPVIINKSCHYQDLHNILLEKFKKHDNDNDASCYHYAKGFLSGPPLTVKTAAKLVWTSSDIIATNSNTIDGLPLSLRDGSIIVMTFDDINSIKAITCTMEKSMIVKKKQKESTFVEKSLKISINENNNINSETTTLDSFIIDHPNPLSSSSSSHLERRLQKEFESVRF